ncbi:2Fe-2S iron-sulfur cluster-binding protein [Antrihabitans sp. YC2-6]|uniref:2Fe-2S iron-sulfur cluster-binding protein n=1 Tax=Antrihabitans sp. YC2-6 TaxID=2799498 RepID=UPI0018F44DC9|nr:2Fe-2S iron-sulfur cluster-binding protein [Antrihabitans sp. YC2-6]MBJ8347074.1 2Fe-2S iron-sulfur cluster binding domain-containing protein [Antrihabitans sp. YC2-6]
MNDIDCSTACSVADLSMQATSSAGAVRILPANVRFSVEPGESIVDAVRRIGYRTRYCCRRGGCGACKADLVAGTVHYSVPIAESVLSVAERREGKCLPCRAHPVGEIVIRLAERDRLRRTFGFINPASGDAGR